MRGNRDRWIKIVAAFLAFIMLLPVVALLIGTATSDEGSLAPVLMLSTILVG